MKFFILTLALLIPAFVLSAQKVEDSQLIVSTTWLAQHLNDPHLVILHAASTNPGYRREHVPGARFLWTSSLSKNTPERNNELPSLSEAARVLKKLGINEDSRIVVYFEGSNVSMGARMVFTLTYLGLGDRVSLLDGGFDAWKKEGRPVTRENPAIHPGTYVPAAHPEFAADAKWVQAHLTDPATAIIDARGKKVYDGEAAAPSGHIPHAANIPPTSVSDSSNKFLSLDALREAFEKAGMISGKHIVAYCNSGQQASMLFLAARRLGYPVRLYDGSFEDWADRELPIERTRGKIEMTSPGRSSPAGRT